MELEYDIAIKVKGFDYCMPWEGDTKGFTTLREHIRDLRSILVSEAGGFAAPGYRAIAHLSCREVSWYFTAKHLPTTIAHFE